MLMKVLYIDPICSCTTASLHRDCICDQVSVCLFSCVYAQPQSSVQYVSSAIIDAICSVAKQEPSILSGHVLSAFCSFLHTMLSSLFIVSSDTTEGTLTWSPALPPNEVTVTDITANSITVTFREAQMAEGFFRDRSVQF